MTRRLVLVMVMAVVASIAAPSFAEQGRTRIVTKNYRFGFFGEVGLMFCDQSGDLVQSNPAIGGACFDREIGENKVTVTIRDAEDWPVAAFYEFTNPLGEDYGSGFFCESAVLAITPGPTRLNISLTSTLSMRWTSCGLDGRPGTNGTITAEFYRPWP